jgi:hypothetical protein
MNASTLYAPRSEDNPWRVLDLKTTEEWMRLALWYPFSVRVLNEIEGRWSEGAVTPSRDQAYHVMKALEAAHRDVSYLVVQQLRYGKEGRERHALIAARLEP